MRRIGDVELSEDMNHERREWIAERVGWAGMALVILAALLGLFGSGPLAHAHASAGALAIDYPRFARHDAESELEVRLPAGRLWLGSELLDHYTVERITPAPDRVLVLADRSLYELGQAGRISLVLRPKRIGRATLRIGVEGGGELRVAQWVFP